MARFDNTPSPCRLKGNALATLVRVFVLTALIVATTQTSAFAANTENIEVRNQTDNTIVAVECVAFNNKWNGKDLLGDNILYDGGTMNIRYSPNVRYFNLRITLENGSHVTWKKIDFNGVDRLILYREGGTYKYVRQ
ncbi:MAG: hypothetical protein IJ774_09685 [Selenomonadaceae bacterium]|nr:hypothetical protein [Selenomonadaceae bacterium]